MLSCLMCYICFMGISFSEDRISGQGRQILFEGKKDKFLFVGSVEVLNLTCQTSLNEQELASS